MTKCNSLKKRGGSDIQKCLGRAALAQNHNEMTAESTETAHLGIEGSVSTVVRLHGHRLAGSLCASHAGFFTELLEYPLGVVAGFPES